MSNEFPVDDPTQLMAETGEADQAATADLADQPIQGPQTILEATQVVDKNGELADIPDLLANPDIAHTVAILAISGSLDRPSAVDSTRIDKIEDGADIADDDVLDAALRKSIASVQATGKSTASH